MPPKQGRPNYVDLKRPTIFAHRGSSAYAPENTLAAFELALEQDADGIELDVKLSADGHVVVIHDDTVDRTTNGTGRVKSMTLAEIKKLDAGSKFAPKFKPQKIPTLEEVFNAVGGKLFINVELTNYTSPTDYLPDKVVSLIKEYHLEPSVLISSFNFIALCKAQMLLPSIPLGLLTISGTTKAIYRSKLVRWNPLLALHPPLADTSPELIRTIQSSGSRVHVYTINQPQEIQNLFTMGVDGIFTDDPVLAKKVLAEVQSKRP
ncbi:MAG TPA: glycerophosphodiester phosphodiesterase [Anaerolineales bacterium]|nr:glycerophosphodiester phosphodiesterase [Anaerolineales bacterium]